VLTEGAKGMSGAVAKAKEIAESDPKLCAAATVRESGQSCHPPKRTTGRRYDDTDGKVDIFVAALAPAAPSPRIALSQEDAR